MADDFVANPGAGGDTFAADDISGVKYPRSKIVIGADGVNDGDVSSSNPLPITAASLPLPTGAATETTLASIDTKVATQTTLAAIETLLSGTITISGTVAATQSGTWNITNISGTVSLPTGAATETTLASALTSLQTLDNIVSGSGVNVTQLPATTSGGPANVSSSATNVTLLASNSSRKGASIMNDSTQILYVKFGATASATSFHIKMAPGTYAEVPFGYTGVIDGIWASANGSARVGEFA